jgi:murein L,D-transpeptidase YafK
MRPVSTIVRASALALSLFALLRASDVAADPRVTEIRIEKAKHRLTLRSGDEVLASYRVAIGPGGAGPKRKEGDRVTPVGRYHVSGRIKGLFHQFLVVSYPNADDVRRFSDAKREGSIPRGTNIGNGIGIHGTGAEDWPNHKASDWTLGCIALDNDEIDEVARKVPDGTAIVITD